jgi:hypothetical protein
MYIRGVIQIHVYIKKILHNYENHDMMYTECIIYEIVSYNRLG